MIARVTIQSAIAFFITAALLNYGVACSAIGRRAETLQLVPAATGLALTVLAFWLAVTLIFGRIYCSSVCPLGALTDLATRLRPARRPFRYRRPLNAVRTIAFLSLTALLVCRVAIAAEWIEPFGLYATVVIALTSGRATLAAAIAAAVTAVIATMAYRRGRLFCNSLCPLSAPLGFIARRSAFHIDINTDRCTQCRRCVDACKAECIDIQDHVADMSRCVVCFNCLPVCPDDAIAYTLSRHNLSDPLMQKIKTLKTENKPSTPLACDNTSNSSATSSTTEISKPTAQEPEH
ncbi:MAG: 4Fe-4S binding protein [Muribaculaceae bacterium]|nr:4Fe-4S binding protein [Muribaculaceae bacterium]